MWYEKSDLVENQDYVCLTNLSSKERGGHNKIEYALTIDCAKELSMVEGNERGKQARRYFIGCRKIWKESSRFLIIESEYNSRGKIYPMYLMNRDGFSLLVMGFIGKKALKFKLEFILAFNLMEKKLKVIDETDDELLARAVVIANKILASHDKTVKDENLRIRGF